MTTIASRCAFLSIVVVWLLIASPAVFAEPNTLTAQEREDGWRLLFDGKTTKGWRNYRRQQVNPGWKVEDGTLVRAAAGAGDIMTEEQFDAFELAIDFKIAPRGNIGLMFHVTEEGGAPWQTGPEVQILDNAAGADPQRAGWLYQLYRPDTDATRPAGEWNEIRLRITPEKSATFVNGVKYYEFVKGSPDWNDRVAKSKFATMTGFGKATKGHICLQDHGDTVAFRSIRIKPLASPR
jgi:hypothetical protein